MTTCENCEGEGRFHRNIVDGWDYWDEGEEWVACPVCGGRGWVVDADPPQQLALIFIGAALSLAIAIMTLGLMGD